MFRIPTADPFIGWLLSDASGVWFAERNTGKVGHLSYRGHVREYALPNPGALPQSMVRAPNGDMYISEYAIGRVARLDTRTGSVREYATPTADSGPLGMTLGRDGNLWLVEREVGKYARMTPGGHFTEWSLGPKSFPNRIVTAPDGAVWLTDLGRNELDRVLPSGHARHFPLAGGPVGIAVGPARSLYVVLYTAGVLARVNEHARLSGLWPLPGAKFVLHAAVATDGAVWVPDGLADVVFRVTP